MSDVDELIAFFRARLDEDKAIALACINLNDRVRMRRGIAPPRWMPAPDSSDIRSEDGILRVNHTWVCEREHICRHDPARVLREVTAKRALIDRYGRAASIAATEGRIVPAFMRGQDNGYAQACLDAIRDAAAIWSDHDDYRPEWAPEESLNEH